MTELSLSDIVFDQSINMSAPFIAPGPPFAYKYKTNFGLKRRLSADYKTRFPLTKPGLEVVKRVYL